MTTTEQVLDENRQAKLITEARRQIWLEWGKAFTLLGDRLQAALMAEAVLNIAAAQDEEVSSDRVRQIVNFGHAWANEAQS